MIGHGLFMALILTKVVTSLPVTKNQTEIISSNTLPLRAGELPDTRHEHHNYYYYNDDDDKNGHRGFWDVVGNWIQGSTWFPVQINVPDTINAIGNNLNNLANTIIEGVFNRPPMDRVRPRPMMVAGPPAKVRLATTSTIDRKEPLVLDIESDDLLSYL